MSAVPDSRLRATQVLAALLQHKGSLATQLRADDDALTRELCFGCCRWYPQLEACLQQLLSKPLKSRDADVRALLWIGLYQLQHLRTPPHAAVHATVAACQALKKPWARGLVNAVLRNFQRQQPTLLASIARQPEVQSLHPQWLSDALRQDWPAQHESLLRANNCHAGMTLRVNLRQQGREAYIAQLEQAGIQAYAGQHSDSAIHLVEPCAVNTLPGFEQGSCSVQDEASQLVPMMLQAAPGMRVLDACAAPGGKTAHLLEQHQDLQLLALDNDARRLQRVEQNLQRLGLQAELRCADAGQPQSWWDGQVFDRILLDAPCSATGIIRRQPDIKLLRRAADIQRLAAEQRQLLDALWPCLAPGGQLLYTTCSVLRQENSQQIADFLARHPDASLDPGRLDTGIDAAPGIQLLPSDSADSTDGFFFAALRKG